MCDVALLNKGGADEGVDLMSLWGSFNDVRKDVFEFVVVRV